MSKGYPYPQPKLSLLVREPAGTPRKITARGEEISPASITVHCDAYIHPTTVGRIALPTRSGSPRIVGGEVMACRHVRGRDHQVIFRFSEAVALDDILSPQEAKAYLAEVKSQVARNEEAPSIAVLLLDDHDADRRLLVTRLGGTNIDLHPVAHLGAAMDAVETRDFDLVLCDYFLEAPHTAHDLLHQFRERGITVPVAVLTSDIDPDRAIDIATQGAVAVLNKPVDHATLAQTLTCIAKGGTAGGASLPPNEATVAFIGTLAERKSLLKRAITRRDLDGVIAICRDLAGASPGYGLIALGRSADRAIGAIEGAGAVDLAGKPLDDLVTQLDRLAIASAA
ncbi:MAG: response regulator [Phycisphaerales bacterium]